MTLKQQQKIQQMVNALFNESVNTNFSQDSWAILITLSLKMAGKQFRALLDKIYGGANKQVALSAIANLVALNALANNASVCINNKTQPAIKYYLGLEEKEIEEYTFMPWLFQTCQDLFPHFGAQGVQITGIVSLLANQQLNPEWRQEAKMHLLKSETEERPSIISRLLNR